MTACRSIATRAGLFALLFVSTACPDDTTDAPVETPTVAVPTSQPSVSAAKPKELTRPTAQQVPVSEDFEAEAEIAIDARTYKKELEALARQIDQEGAN